jgi:hypothetical protein
MTVPPVGRAMTGSKRFGRLIGVFLNRLSNTYRTREKTNGVWRQSAGQHSDQPHDSQVLQPSE